MSETTSIGDRMKRNYETPFRLTLPWRSPVVIRLDGKAFHSWTSGLKRPFDEGFIGQMQELALYLCKEVQTTVLAYVFSDEISLLLHGYKRLNSEPWFSNQLQKMVSVSAGLASAKFTQITGRIGVFDSRVFTVPEADVVNYFLWRQQDAARNSIQMVAQSLYSHKELHAKGEPELHELLYQKGVNWNDYPTQLRRGSCIRRIDDEWAIDREIPLFSENRLYVGSLLAIEQE